MRGKTSKQAVLGADVTLTIGPVMTALMSDPSGQQSLCRISKKAVEPCSLEPSTTDMAHNTRLASTIPNKANQKLNKLANWRKGLQFRFGALR